MWHYVRKSLKKIIHTVSVGKTGKPEIILTDEYLKINNADGSNATIGWQDITKVSVLSRLTNPVYEELYLCLYTPDGNKCIIPEYTKGYDDVYRTVSKFKGFNNDKYLEAMMANGEGEFVCWTR